MTTPAEELRAAAAKLRSLFDHLGSEGLAAWEATPDPVTGLYGVRTDHAPGGDVLVATGMWKSTAAFIAAMHPGAAFALADWLDSSAQLHEPTVCGKHEGCAPLGCQWCADEDWPCADMRHALAVARALNGGQS